MIGHTQPRRLAARTVAARIAEELGTEVGDAVGWKVRFTDQVGENTLVKLMTDGILLAELTGDRMLREYDTLIIDEAHERSLNIDFILGYLAQLLPRRPDLKVDHHLGDDRPGALLRSTSADAPDRRGLRPLVPRRGALPAGRRSRRPGRRSRPRPARRHRRRRRRAAARGPGRRAGVPARRAGDPRHRRRAGASATSPASRSCRCSPACPPPSSSGCSRRTRRRWAAGSCWPPTSPRRR